MSNNTENSAARLLGIIEAGRVQSPNAKCRDTWHKILNVPADDPVLLMSRMGKVMALPDEIRAEIASVGDLNVGSYLRWTPRFSKAFSQQDLDQNWSTFISLYNRG